MSKRQTKAQKKTANSKKKASGKKTTPNSTPVPEQKPERDVTVTMRNIEPHEMTFHQKILGMMAMCMKVVCSGVSKNEEYCYTKSADVFKIFKRALLQYGLIFQIVDLEARDVRRGCFEITEIKGTYQIRDEDGEHYLSMVGIGHGSNDHWSPNSAQTMALKQAILNTMVMTWEDPAGMYTFEHGSLGSLAEIKERLDAVTSPLGNTVEKPKPTLISGDTPSPKKTKGMKKPNKKEQGFIDELLEKWVKAAQAQNCTVDCQAAINSIYEANGNKWPQDEAEVNRTASNTVIMPQILRTISHV